MIHKVKRKQNSSNDCFICGIKNESGLNMDFYEMDNDELVGIFNAKSVHQSYPGRTHGGVIAAILDETIGRTINIYEPEAFGVTTTLNIKYRKPVPYEKELKVIAKITKNTSRYFEGTGKIIDENGKVLAEANGEYAKLPISTIMDNLDSTMMFMHEKDTDYKEIDY